MSCFGPTGWLQNNNRINDQGFLPFSKTGGFGVRLDFNKLIKQKFYIQLKTSMKNIIDLNPSSYCMPITVFISLLHSFFTIPISSKLSL